MILKMQNYKYPTRKEWLDISSTFPEMGRFGFSFVKETTVLLGKEKSTREVHQLQNLYHWDFILSKKVWNLRQSYVNAIVNYERGIPQTEEEFKMETRVINLYQFDFYYETSLYYLISVRDIILQIVNIGFDIGIPEWKVSVKVFKDQAPVGRLREILERAFSGLNEVGDLRNSMAHRYSKTSNDHRSRISENGRKYGHFRREAISHSERISMLNLGIEALHQFYNEVRDELKGKFPLEED